ncbi:MAG: NnrS family protein [Candidatus Competibacteraceae bacterium]|nr:NnrS family protein [Candidatus Competibacteraceae bacterium]
MAGPAAILAAAVNIVRMWHWRFLATLRIPMLWILYAGYAWIIVALVLKGLVGVVPWITPSTAVHALTVGAIGSLTLGMMSRVALAHTGRTIVATSSITIAFVLINASAILRIMVPIAIPVFYWSGLVVSGLLWAVAFALFVIYYTPILIQPRIDGSRANIDRQN